MVFVNGNVNSEMPTSCTEEVESGNRVHLYF